MSITSAIVLYVVIWFLVMFVTLPFHERSQAEDGDVVPGTQEGAPAHFRVKRTVVFVTIIATVVWAIAAGIIISGWISVRDIDLRGVLG